MIKKKNKFNPKKYIKQNYMENGKVDISINVASKDTFYDELDVKKITLSKNIEDYIESKLKNVIYKSGVVLTFHTPELSDDEQEDIAKLIRSHYGLILFKNKRELNITKIKIFILFIIGISFLALTHILPAEYVLVKDVLLIVGWVSIWEIVSTVLFDTIKVQREKYNYQRLYNAKIKFEIRK